MFKVSNCSNALTTRLRSFRFGMVSNNDLLKNFSRPISRLGRRGGMRGGVREEGWNEGGGVE